MFTYIADMDVKIQFTHLVDNWSLFRKIFCISRAYIMLKHFLIYLIKYTTQQEQVIENNKISATKLCSNFFKFWFNVGLPNYMSVRCVPLTIIRQDLVSVVDSSALQIVTSNQNKTRCLFLILSPFSDCNSQQNKLIQYLRIAH